jgi:hypothetical protein
MSSLDQRIDALRKEMAALAQETKQNEEARLKLLKVCQMSSMGIVQTTSEQIWQVLFQVGLASTSDLGQDLSLMAVTRSPTCRRLSQRVSTWAYSTSLPRANNRSPWLT